MIGSTMIGQLTASTGLSVRTLRFYADAGVLPARERAASGYRLFGPDAVARARPCVAVISPPSRRVPQRRPRPGG